MSLESILSQLEIQQLIHAAKDEDTTYIFKNVLSQQAAYQSLLTRNRRELHRCVAETYEKMYAGREDEIAVLLAQHYAEAGDDAKTYEYSARAGNAALRVYAIAEGIQHLARAAEIAQRLLAANPSTDASNREIALRQVYLNLGRAFELSGKYEDALKNYEAMETLGHARGDSTMELDAIISLATLRSTPTTLYDATLGQSLSDWGIKVAREAGNREAEAKILWNLMNLCFFTLRPAEGIEYGERALAIARELGLTERIAYILNDINRLYLATGELAKARQSVNEARELWRTLNNLPMLADNFGSGAEIGQYAYELDAAYAEATQAIELARSIENLWTLSYALATHAFVRLERGEMDDALEIVNESIANARQAGFTAGVDIGRSELAMTYAYLGAVEQGVKLINQVIAEASTSFTLFLPWVMSYAARLYIRQGRVADAEQALVPARENLHSTGSIIYIVNPFGITTAEFAMAKKDFAGAIQAAQPIIERNQKFGVQFLYLEACVLQGRAYEMLGQLDEAEKIYAQGRARAQAVGSRRMLWLLLLGLSRIARARGNIASANELRDKARAVVAFIVDHLSDQNLRGSFLNLPDVREVTA